MERLITVGLTVLLVSLTAPSVKAEKQTEQQEPVKTETQAPAKYSTNTATEVKPESVPTANPVKLSERDRIIREYQTQMVIPAQEQ